MGANEYEQLWINGMKRNAHSWFHSEDCIKNSRYGVDANTSQFLKVRGSVLRCSMEFYHKEYGVAGRLLAS